MQGKRLSRLDASLDPMIAVMLSTLSDSAGRATQIRWTTLNGREMTSSCDLKVTLVEMLHHMVDGCGLVLLSQVPQSHHWLNPVCSGGASNTMCSYIAAIRVRGNLIGTTLRRARG